MHRCLFTAGCRRFMNLMRRYARPFCQVRMSKASISLRATKLVESFHARQINFSPLMFTHCGLVAVYCRYYSIQLHLREVRGGSKSSMISFINTLSRRIRIQC